MAFPGGGTRNFLTNGLNILKTVARYSKQVGAKQKKIVGGVQPQFADKKILFEHNMPTNRTFLEIY